VILLSLSLIEKSYILLSRVFYSSTPIHFFPYSNSQYILATSAFYS